MVKSRCVACNTLLREDEANRMACRTCEDTARLGLTKLAGQNGLFAQLVWTSLDALTPAAGRQSSGPVVKTSKTVAPPPVRMGSLNLLGAGGVVHTLQRWVRVWYDQIGFRPPTWSGPHQYQTVLAPGGQPVRRPGQLDRTVDILINNLPWAAENRDDFGDFCRDVRKFIEASKSALDPTIERHDKVRVGNCPATAHEGACGTPLLADPFASSIKCHGCGAVWNRADWIELSRRMQAG